MPPPYNPQLLTSIQRTVTHERLRRYLNATGQDVSLALELYEHNVRLSEVLYGLLHGLEVTVRNDENHALCAGYGTPAWYDLAPLSPYWLDQIRAAKRKPGLAGRPGNVVAELSFGFWVDLLKMKNHRSLWVDRKLNAAFPNTRLTRDLIHTRLKAIQLLRNRISHHEPVLTSGHAFYNGNMMLTLSDLLECVQWVCCDTTHWMKTAFRYADAERILCAVAASGAKL